MIDLLAGLGAPGVILVLAVVVVTTYLAVKPFRGRATWWSDLAAVRRGLDRRHATRELTTPRPCPGFDHPLYRETGLPRSVRWPYNWWRAQLAFAWSIRLKLGRSIFGYALAASIITAGLVSAGLYALVITFALAFVTIPAAAVGWLGDTVTVARGGTQGRRSSYKPTLTFDAVLVHRQWARLNVEQVDRLALVRAQLPKTTGTAAWPSPSPVAAPSSYASAAAAASPHVDTAPGQYEPLVDGRRQGRARPRIRPVLIFATAALLFAVWHVGNGVMDGLDVENTEPAAVTAGLGPSTD